MASKKNARKKSALKGWGTRRKKQRILEKEFRAEFTKKFNAKRKVKKIGFSNEKLILQVKNGTFDAREYPKKTLVFSAILFVNDPLEKARNYAINFIKSRGFPNAPEPEPPNDSGSFSLYVYSCIGKKARAFTLHSRLSNTDAYQEAADFIKNNIQFFGAK